MVGQPNVRFHLRGQDYEYNFESMRQRNLNSSKEREIRPPQSMAAPPKPILPLGYMTVIRVPQGAGKTMEIQDPNTPGQKITVALPPGASPGKHMAVPLPGKGEDVQAVMEKQKSGWPAAAKAVAGAVGVGGVAVGGVVLGEHLSGGAISEATGIGEIATAAEWTEGAVGDAGEWIAGAAGDAHEWLEGAGEDVGRAVMGTAEDVGEWTADAFDDVTDWIGDAGEDIGSFVMELF
uniref:WWE domain-containing protein n=1 Tax=Zooxanthella nutricula TaxID=1333877 RepID=A0A7S2QHF1_9DINO